MHAILSYLSVNFVVLGVGLLAQLLFFIRMIVQWISSERAKRVLSPVLFWQISLIASFIFCMYGWLRNDFAIILGQLVSYYIYIWNLKVEKRWKQIPAFARLLLNIMPLMALGYACFNMQDTITRLFHQEDVPLWLILFGSAGQLIFVFRFIYQWWYSKQRMRSVLPFNFWVISTVGSSIIFFYGLIRLDLILIAGQSASLFIYLRNMMLWKNRPED